MEIKELGNVVLYVRDLDRSHRFYRDVLGWREIGNFGDVGAAFSAGRTHHELLPLEVGSAAQPIPAGRCISMYHFGPKIGTSDVELRAALRELREKGVTVSGAADHTVTHSLYIEDPDGNEIELYIDVQPEIWRDNLTAVMAPLKLLQL